MPTKPRPSQSRSSPNPRRTRAPRPAPTQAPAAAGDENEVHVPPAPRAPRVLSYDRVRRLKRLAAALHLRKNEALRLYEPLERVTIFHESKRRTKLLRGSVRSGKSLGAAVEFARAVTGQDPFGKYPASGLAFMVGLNEQHLGRVMWRMLAKPGAYKIIKDLRTGKWRAFRPDEERDREHEARPAPPLIPKRFIRKITYHKKAMGVPEYIQFTTGWEAYCFSSNAQPAQGDSLNLGWIDEEISNEEWLPELRSRCVTGRGTLIWSACPQVANPQLFEISEQAADGDPDTLETLCLMDDNPHVPPEERDLLAKGLTDEQRRVRLHGEFLLTSFLVYPEYNKKLHWWEPPPGWSVPADWARYLVVDPGRQICAVLFVALPPPWSRDNHFYVYDELYIKDCDARKFADLVAAKSEGVVYESFTIDGHAGRVSEMGSGLTVEQQYSAALAARNVACRKSGSHFAWGSDDVKGRTEEVRALLRIDPVRGPRLRVVAGRLKHLENEFKRYHFKRVKNLITDEIEKKHDHLMDCLGYAAAAKFRWHKPPKPKAPKSPALKALEAKRKRQSVKRGNPGLVRVEV